MSENHYEYLNGHVPPVCTFHMVVMFDGLSGADVPIALSHFCYEELMIRTPHHSSNICTSGFRDLVFSFPLNSVDLTSQSHFTDPRGSAFNSPIGIWMCVNEA